MDELSLQLQEIFRDVFDDPTLILDEGMTALDVEGWDSVAHVNLIIAMEQKLGIKFATAEISRLGDQGQNVGTLLEMIRRKRG
jgi:acyl carrier protein